MFQGFTQETVDFMWGIRFNNERGWFLEHKEDYQKHLLEPVKALGEDIYKGVQEMLPREPLLLKVRPYIWFAPAAVAASITSPTVSSARTVT